MSDGFTDLTGKIHFLYLYLRQRGSADYDHLGFDLRHKLTAWARPRIGQAVSMPPSIDIA